MQTGIVYAVLAYVLWGISPIYFKLIQSVAPTEILAHRMAWSLVLMVLILGVRAQWRWLIEACRQPRMLLGSAACALLLGVNWLVYIWAINTGHVVEASLGYFINPLVNVLLGSLLLKERLRVRQWLAIALALLGVAWLTWQGGRLPWIGLALAFTFATYGLLRKTAALGALEGLALETMLIFPFAAIYLVWLANSGASAFVAGPLSMQMLLAAAGPVTAVPLLFFAAAARRIPFSLLGLLQYIGPSIQLALAVWLFHEPFNSMTLIGFAAIWAALALYSLEAIWRSARQPSAAAATTAV